MAFESLTEKFQKVFRNLRGKGRLSEEDVRAALKEVKMALLEADVNFKVVKRFIKSVEERAVGQDVLEALTPGQQVIKIVNEELVSLMGGEPFDLKIDSSVTTVIMMVGLQGAGKTTSAVKLASRLRSGTVRPLLIACDIYRPAAIEQLRVNCEKQKLDCYYEYENKNVPDIVRAGMAHAAENRENLIIIDTAGRLHIDEDMMNELKAIKETVNVRYTILTADSMTGQDAVNAATEFNEQIGIDGVILSKLDGDMRGGAALSIRAVTEKPILFTGTGEKLTDLDVFYPDRMASRILGMGDVLSLIEKAQEDFDENKAREMAAKLRKNKFDFNDYLEQLVQIRKMGGVNSMMSMLPSLGGMKMPAQVDEKQFDRIETMILSMTKEERENPEILNMSRRNRISRGSGIPIAEVNRTVKQFNEMQKMMSNMQKHLPNKNMMKLLGGKFKWQ